jgi:hypothetical protein
MTTIPGRFGLSFNIFKGIKPTVSFENGYCMIAFEYSSMIFTRLPTISNSEYPDVLEKFFLITLCEDCPESSICKNVHHKVSKFLRLEHSKVFMVDIEGKEFDCPVSNVRIESNPRVMKGEYTRILRQTAPTTSEEHQFVFELVDSLSGGNFILDTGRDVAFSWLELGAQ